MSKSTNITCSYLVTRLTTERRFLVLIFIVALVSRLGFVLFFPRDLAGHKFDPQDIYQDERGSDETASNLLNGIVTFDRGQA